LRLCCCRGTPRKYLDALLAASRLELFRPGVDLLAAGDAVNELFVVVAGRIELRSGGSKCLAFHDAALMY
jgi:signal-transduction protein with cAMP-binding, CBS, and nucleotidyltransferase domain